MAAQKKNPFLLKCAADFHVPLIKDFSLYLLTSILEVAPSRGPSKCASHAPKRMLSILLGALSIFSSE